MLIAAGAVDLLSDGRDILSSVIADIHGYPLSNLIAFSALLLLLIVHAILKRHTAEQPPITSESCPVSPTGGSDVQTCNTLHSDSNRFIHSQEKSNEVTEDLVALRLKSGSLTSAVVLTLGLGFHSFLAGLALGAQTDISHLLKILGPILAHKALAAMALGSSLIRADVAHHVFITVVTLFSLTTPVGITLGTAVQSMTEEIMWEGVCLCLAAGTFFYIAVVDIIPESLNVTTSNLDFIAQIVALLVGYGLMAALNIWV